jgi:sugar transferase EpsL
MNLAYRVGKRLTDILFGILLFVPGVAVCLAVGPLLAWRLGSGQIFFVQWRPGLHARPFRIFKLKTLLDLHDASGEPLPDGERRFALGDWLRHLHLDELPQALNLLNGTMSVVGPRPLLMEYLPLYTPEQALRHRVKPGLISPAVLAGGNALDWDTRLKLDAEYTQTAGFYSDLKVFRVALFTLFGTTPREGGPKQRIVAERFRGATAPDRAQEV